MCVCPSWDGGCSCQLEQIFVSYLFRLLQYYLTLEFPGLLGKYLLPTSHLSVCRLISMRAACFPTCLPICVLG